METKYILVTGAAGYIGSLFLKKLVAENQSNIHSFQWGIIALDIKEIPESDRLNGVNYIQTDIRSKDWLSCFKEYSIDTVVHLAAMINPPKALGRDVLYDIEVNGSRYLLDACIEYGVPKFITTSSGAAYGYHEDNSEWLTENDPVRGNYEFPYSFHKRLVEELMAKYRQEYPALKQFIFRVGTILGRSTNNLITDLFNKKIMIGIKGSQSPFVFIWDKDVVNCLYQALESDQDGIYNLAGDGALSTAELAAMMGKKYRPIPEGLMRLGLKTLKRVGVGQYGPEQIGFLKYRPLLNNEKLKRVFGYQPAMKSMEVFEYYRKENSYCA